jgi:hypothetical protein
MVMSFLIAFTLPVLAQVATKTGSIYGKVNDEKGAALPGVIITLESTQIPPQTATSGASGGFRFANLPPGVYSVNFAIEGFSEVRQEDVRVSTGSQVQLEITLRPSLAEEFTVIGETPVVDTKKTGLAETFNRNYLEDVPNARDPWVIIDQTTGVDTDRYNVAGSESGQQASFIARGGSDDNTIWNYDGVNATDPQSLGASPTYFDFDAFEELNIVTAGSDASIPTGGVAVNIVTKRAGNKWSGNASYYFVNDSLQGSNTPQELIDNPNLNPFTGEPIKGSNRLDEVKDWGFDLGGPIIKDKLFVWGAYRRNEIGLFTITDLIDFTKLEDINFKTNVNWNTAHETQFGYFNGKKTKNGRAAFDAATMAPEALWTQLSEGTILPGLWTGQHTWIPNDHTIVTGRYGYIGNVFDLIPEGGKDVPMIYLAAIPHWEQTSFFVSPIDRGSHDFVVDTNYYRENMMGGDHEFKFGFEYKTSKISTFSSYGNGVLVVDYYQTTPNGPLTSGYLYAQHYIDGTMNIDRTSFYVTDTYRKNRLTLNLGFRFDRQTGNNEAASIPAVPGFEQFVGPLDFAGNDPGVDFNDFSPRLGVTYDLTGDGKTVVRGNFARYYDTYNSAFLTHSNPTFIYNGAQLFYSNADGDRVVDPDEITGVKSFYGGWTQNGYNFDSRLYDPDLKNSNSWEYLVGFERQLMQDLSVSVTYTHRDYRDATTIVPFGIDQSDFVPAGVFTANTPVGVFNVPYFTLPFTHDGTLIVTNANDYKTSYNGVDINARKRMSSNFMINGGLTLQKQKANYDGGDSTAFYIGDGGLTGQVFPFDPTNLPFLDGEPYAFAPLGSGKSGVYPYSEWQLKLSGVYQFPWDISAGAFARYQQGYPYVLFARVTDPTLAAALATSFHLFAVEPFGSRRYDDMFTLDLQFEKGFEMGSYGRLALSANVFNVTNTNTIIRRQRRVNASTFNKIEENISPRAVRLGIRYSF